MATLVTGTLAILSAPWALGQPWLNFVFKPLTTLLIIAYAWPRGAATPVRRRWVLAGLALSLCGDVALMWPQQGFLPGLVSFLLAHLAYLVAFTRDGVRLAARPMPFVLYGALAALILWQLWPGVPAGAARCRCWPTCCAWPRWRRRPRCCGLAARGTARQRGGARAGPRRRAVPGLRCLAGHQQVRRRRCRWSGLWILCSYWLAQWCIASWLPPRPHMPLNKPA